MRGTTKFDKITFNASDMLIILGIGAVLGGLAGIIGVVGGALCAMGGWAMIKFKKKEVKKNAK